MKMNQRAIRAKIKYYQSAIEKLNWEYVRIEVSRAECHLLRRFVAARKAVRSQGFAQPRRLARSSRNRSRPMQNKPVTF